MKKYQKYPRDWAELSESERGSVLKTLSNLLEKPLGSPEALAAYLDRFEVNNTKSARIWLESMLKNEVLNTNKINSELCK